MTSGCHNKSASPFSESAEEDLSTFQLEPGFKIELIASEPLVRDPVDMTIDEYGRMYVVEMPGMPLNKSGLGKVIMLSDTSGDGKMDKRTVFADSLIMPSGVTRWKKGILVTDPPKVYYMEDTQGDGIADIKKVVLTGFDTSNLEANVNNPEYGLDNWVYLADLPVGGGSGIRYADDTAGTALPESSVRFRPDRRQLEVLSGQTQFGQAFDAWGNHLLVNNSNHIFQNVVATRYLQRNPDLVAPSAIQTLADHSEVFPITKNPEYQMLTNVGVFTSACGLATYLGGAFPDPYNHDVTFVCEPVSNVVHVDRLSSDGVTFKANRILDHKEFLASTDPYCRLVNMYTGPDGALYVVDFYRQVIEGPEFMSQEVLDSVDLYNGTHKGRIYRISAKDAAAPEWTKGLELGNATDQQLVEKLADKNIWWRRNAQRLLVDRKPAGAVPLLTEMAQNTKSPMGRLHALWTLEGMDTLSSALITRALKDPEAGIRENAIKLAELHLSADPSLAAALLPLKDDPDRKVRFQLLLTLGFLDTPEVNQIRQQLLFRDINDKWVQLAALSASSSQATALLDAVLAKFDAGNAAYALLVKSLSAIIGKSQPAAVMQPYVREATAVSAAQGRWQAPLLEGLAEGLGSRKDLPAGIEAERALLMQSCLEHPAMPIREGALNILKVIGLSPGAQTQKTLQKARQMAADAKLPEEQRAGAIDFLALQSPASYSSLLKSLIVPREPLPVQLAALRALSLVPGLEVSQYILQRWLTLSPELRNAAINAFMSDDRRIDLLLNAVASGKINTGEISWSQSVRLRSLGNMELRKRARTLLTQKSDERENVIKDYRAALSLKGDAAKGKAIFQQNCSVCHQVRGKEGRAFGPDLGTVHAWAPSDIMINILDPNRSIAHGYDSWDVSLNNGESAQGIISEETPTAITLSDANGHTSNIARQDIKSLKALKLSPMPLGLEKKIDKQQMADLLSFLRQGE
ncbi:c-type cytochrome [Compostibacter hankyongensis]|uniref:C-type cytochrome n=1 Tax=Compostibacter hankyongensis TaxID=1007089 RepID=A0ABP8FEF8_9BACT